MNPVIFGSTYCFRLNDSAIGKCCPTYWISKYDTSFELSYPQNVENILLTLGVWFLCSTSATFPCIQSDQLLVCEDKSFMIFYLRTMCYIERLLQTIFSLNVSRIRSSSYSSTNFDFWSIGLTLWILPFWILTFC